MIYRLQSLSIYSHRELIFTLDSISLHTIILYTFTSDTI
nr:MAG TPA: hypothetical protein [Caudoviricetes sp.]